MEQLASLYVDWADEVDASGGVVTLWEGQHELRAVRERRGLEVSRPVRVRSWGRGEALRVEMKKEGREAGVLILGPLREVLLSVAMDDLYGWLGAATDVGEDEFSSSPGVG